MTSPVSGAVRPLVDAIAVHVTERADAPTLVWRGERLTYGDLGALAQNATDALHGLRLADRAPVGVLGGKSPQAVALILACLAAGHPVLLTSPDLPGRTDFAVKVSPARVA
jgi:acyl-CoA synthetase (AMP-forming)/AMP-acid ligase II